MPKYTRPLGDSIKCARDRQELTQAKVAEMIDVDVRTVLNIENYKGNPKLEVLFPLICVLNIDPNEIFYPERFQENSDAKHLHFLIDTCSDHEIAILDSIIAPLLTILRSKEIKPNE